MNETNFIDLKTLENWYKLHPYTLDLICIDHQGLTFVFEINFYTGFTELRLEDQMALLKSSFMELNVLRLSYRSVWL